MALSNINFTFELREVNLKNRPEELYKISPKGTVPVLCFQDGNVIDESINIMKWANNLIGKEHLLITDKNIQYEIIEGNDKKFKPSLDKYKYFDRYPENSQDYYQEECVKYLLNMDKLLQKNNYIMGKKIQFVDIALFPFIRQFRAVNIEWFRGVFENIYVWYKKISNSQLFLMIMKKYDFWDNKNNPLIIDYRRLS